MAGAYSTLRLHHWQERGARLPKLHDDGPIDTGCSPGKLTHGKALVFGRKLLFDDNPHNCFQECVHWVEGDDVAVLLDKVREPPMPA